MFKTRFLWVGFFVVVVTTTIAIVGSKSEVLAGECVTDSTSYAHTHGNARCPAWCFNTDHGFSSCDYEEELSTSDYPGRHGRHTCVPEGNSTCGGYYGSIFDDYWDYWWNYWNN
jgi:hypothetical protein